ncbi:MAG: glutathione S-transferase C-terminal domain-containing protein [Oligoflexales bacterium]|nr:glutathione S-transferase C-terminal domain-containing protein [Oligoflexales bacterium]
MTKNDEHKNSIILYQWPASRYCDSIYVRCTKIQRVLGLLKIPYQVADIGWPNANDENLIGTKVDPLMRKIPIIKLPGGQFIEDTNRIVDYLQSKAKYQGFKITDDRMRSYVHFFSEWVEHWLVWLVIYGRWVREENYARLLQTLGEKVDQSKIKKSVDYTRKRACMIIKNTEVGGLSESDYLQSLMNSLDQIDSCLKQGPFMTGIQIREIDISLFMCLQAFYDPSLSEERDLMMGYPNIKKWIVKVDTETRSVHTKSPFVGKIKRAAS